MDGLISIQQILAELECRIKTKWLNENSISKEGVANLLLLKSLHHSPSCHMSYFKSEVYCRDLVVDFSVHAAKIFKHYKSTTKIGFDISEVGGMSASKSSLYLCGTMTHFVDRYCLPYFEVNEEYLTSNLAHSEIRIIHNPHTTDSIYIYGWKDTLYLSNGGGSHHFATAQYIAKKLNKPVPLQAHFNLFGLDRNAIRNLFKHYHAFLIPNHYFAYIREHLYDTAINAFAYHMQRQSSDSTLFIFKRDIQPDEDSKNNYVAKVLSRAFTNLEDELMAHYYTQCDNIAFNRYLKHVEPI